MELVVGSIEGITVGGFGRIVGGLEGQKAVGSAELEVGSSVGNGIGLLDGAAVHTVAPAFEFFPGSHA